MKKTSEKERVKMDFFNITPCGGNCSDCEHYISGTCKGCLSPEGRCKTLWNSQCAIFECCLEHDVKFCGLCKQFSGCKTVRKISEWDSSGIERLEMLASLWHP